MNQPHRDNPPRRLSPEELEELAATYKAFRMERAENPTVSKWVSRRSFQELTSVVVDGVPVVVLDEPTAFELMTKAGFESTGQRICRVCGFYSAFPGPSTACTACRPRGRPLRPLPMAKDPESACSEPDCPYKRYAKGLCQRHYSRAYQRRKQDRDE